MTCLVRLTGPQRSLIKTYDPWQPQTGGTPQSPHPHVDPGSLRQEAQHSLHIPMLTSLHSLVTGRLQPVQELLRCNIGLRLQGSLCSNSNSLLDTKIVIISHIFALAKYFLLENFFPTFQKLFFHHKEFCDY